MAKKATVKKAGQKPAPKAARTARPKKAGGSPRLSQGAQPAPASVPAPKKSVARNTVKSAFVSRSADPPSLAKKVESVANTGHPKKKPAPRKAAASGSKPGPDIKIEPVAKARGGNNRSLASDTGIDGRSKAKPSLADGSAPLRSSKPVRIDRRPMVVEPPAEIPPTYLTPAELESFREMLLEKRHELIGDVANLEDGAIRSGGAHSASGLSSMPIHMADIGSDTWEQELTLGLIENERGLLREIDEALERIKDGTYGMCLATGKPITKARLRAKPWAKYCIEYARKRELGLV